VSTYRRSISSLVGKFGLLGFLMIATACEEPERVDPPDLSPLLRVNPPKSEDPPEPPPPPPAPAATDAEEETPEEEESLAEAHGGVKTEARAEPAGVPGGVPGGVPRGTPGGKIAKDGDQKTGEEPLRGR
jgi:hypothetical protein